MVPSHEKVTQVEFRQVESVVDDNGGELIMLGKGLQEIARVSEVFFETLRKDAFVCPYAALKVTLENGMVITFLAKNPFREEKEGEPEPLSCFIDEAPEPAEHSSDGLFPDLQEKAREAGKRPDEVARRLREEYSGDTEPGL